MEAARQICKNIDDKVWGEDVHEKIGGLEKFGIKITRDKNGQRVVEEQKKESNKASIVAEDRV